MKIAVIADIHANLAALAAVIADFKNVDKVICCGDMVGYYPDANEVCDTLRNLTGDVIRGNHDAYILGEIKVDEKKSQMVRVEWTRKLLTAENISWLKNLPLQLNFVIDDLEILVRHANPWDEEIYLYTDSKYLNEIKLRKNQLLIVGHTHYPMYLKSGAGFILNPGSVGQPRDYNSRACYATIDTVTKTILHHRVFYDVMHYQDKLREMGWDKKVIDILSRTKS